MVYQRVHKSSSWNLPNQDNSSQFAPRPFAAQAQQDSHRPPFLEQVENEAFNQNKVEATGLRLKEEHGTMTSVEQQKLGVLQAKVNDFSEQRTARMKAQPNVLDILIRNAQITKTPTSQAPVQYNTIQAKRDAIDNRPDLSMEKHPNPTGMPDRLKAGVENLSGYSLDNVRVHYNSPKPAQLQALAYAQGTEIHIAPGQEEHLPHEAWHVVQQMQGRVKPTTQANGMVNVNDDAALEQEADVLGEKALGSKSKEDTNSIDQENNVVESIATQNIERVEQLSQETSTPRTNTVQRKITVGTTDYDANGAKNLIKANVTPWHDDYYSQVLVSFDAKDQKFSDTQKLIDAVKYNGDWLLDYKTKASAEAAQNFNNYILGSGTLLHDLVYKVIEDSVNNESAVKDMSHDNAQYNFTPETQLANCLFQCIKYTEDALALCLYTSYFYEPLNKFLRGQYTPDQATSFGQLVVATAKVLENSYQNNTQTSNEKYRLELNSSWIADNETSIEFKSPISTHPDLAGVNNMWGDVASGTFGSFSDFALLCFEGQIKTKRPILKYFQNEVEDLIGPGTSYTVISSYPVNGDIPNIGNRTIRVFHLSNLPTPTPIKQLTFADIVP